MFGKEKTNSYEVPVAPTKSLSKDVTTLIGEGCKVEGSFFVPTTTRIDGIIKGDLTGEIGIIIGNTGKIEGNVCSKEVLVYGVVAGNIEADRLELKRGCKVEGDITVNFLLTENGAIFNGGCAMKQEKSYVNETTDNP
jgi:cytoskeletal protein CcmA (bactofilin family)